MENKAIEVGVLSCGSEISERFMENCFDDRSLADPLNSRERWAFQGGLDCLDVSGSSWGQGGRVGQSLLVVGFSC